MEIITSDTVQIILADVVQLNIQISQADAAMDLMWGGAWVLSQLIMQFIQEWKVIKLVNIWQS